MKSLLDKVNAKLNAQGGFLKAVSVLVGGTAFAQLIGFLCLPILTRLYTPEDYSVLGMYVAIVSILAVISCLRFDIAIPIPDKENDGKALLLLSFFSNAIFSIFLYLLLCISYPYIQHHKIINQLSYWIWLIPLGVFISGFYSALQYWATRQKRFKDIAKTRMTQAISGNTASMACGLLSFGFGGLIIGQLLNFSGGLFKLAISAKKDLAIVKSSHLKVIFKKYSNFPKFSVLEALANTSAIHLPLIFIASLLIGPEVGYIMLAMKMMTLPMSILGSTIAQVYYAQAAKKKKDKELQEYTLQIIIHLQKIACLIPIISIILYYIISIILGNQWERTGEIIIWMAPWFVFQFMSSPISMVMHIRGKQKKILLLTIFGLILRISIIGLAYLYYGKYLAEAFAISSALFYLICYFVFCTGAGIGSQLHFYIFRKNIFYIFPSFFVFGIFLLLGF